MTMNNDNSPFPPSSADETSGPTHVEGTPPGEQERRAWSEFQNDMNLLGEQLAQLRVHSEQLGETLLNTLDSRYQELKARAFSWKDVVEGEISQLRTAAQRQAHDAQDAAQGAYDEAKTRSRERARQFRERSDALRQGARDVTEGLGRAWTELRGSFDKARGRMNQETPPSAPPENPNPFTPDEPKAS